jgi:hypothetical protein
VTQKSATMPSLVSFMLIVPRAFFGIFRMETRDGIRTKLPHRLAYKRNGRTLSKRMVSHLMMGLFYLGGGNYNLNR